MSKHKLSKVKAVTGSKKQKGQGSACQNMSAEEREERIQYLIGLFRLSFRTSQQYAEGIDAIEPDDYYDNAVDCSMEQRAGFGFDDDIEDFRADFKALDAENKFIECCLDYYQDVVTETKTHLEKDQKRLIALRKEMADGLLDKKSKRANTKDQTFLEERIAMNSAHLTAMEQKLQSLTQSKNIVTDDKCKD